MSDAAALMDRVYARQRHIYDATRKFYLLGRDGLIADLDAAPGATILEIGCGTGRNLIAIAKRYPDAICFGLDVSSAMLATARKAIDDAGLATRIRIAQADATTFDPDPLFGVQRFDRVVISYALSMIPPWRDVLRRGAGVVAPGGSLHLVDFGDQAGLPGAFKQMLLAWLSRFHVSPRETLPGECAALAEALGFAETTRSLYRGYAVSARLSAPVIRSIP